MFIVSKCDDITWQLEHPWAISQRLYDHWKVALSSYFGVSIIEPVLSILYPNPNFTVNLAANLVLALAWIPGFLYIFGEFARLSDASDAFSKRVVRMMLIGFIAFFGFGVAIPHSYRIAFDAFSVNLPMTRVFTTCLSRETREERLSWVLQHFSPEKSDRPKFRSPRELSQQGLATRGTRANWILAGYDWFRHRFRCHCVRRLRSDNWRCNNLANWIYDSEILGFRFRVIELAGIE